MVNDDPTVIRLKSMLENLFHEQNNVKNFPFHENNTSGKFMMTSHLSSTFQPSSKQ
jgi:hypothetical protein